MLRLALVATLVVTSAAVAHALDRPIAGVKLVSKRSNGREKIAFVSKDPAALFPAIGSADDPSTGGAVVELFSEHGGSAWLPVPAGVEWLPKADTPPSCEP